MKKSNERVPMWVHPLFKKAAKKKAADEGKSMIDFTEDLGKEWETLGEKKERKQHGRIW